MKRNTLDLDNCSGEKLLRVYSKIVSCKRMFSVRVCRSAGLNGFHVEMWCRGFCEDCRLVFDDPIRFMLDHHYRRTSEQNVLFRQKTFKKAGQHIVMKVSL